MVYEEKRKQIAVHFLGRLMVLTHTQPHTERKKIKFNFPPVLCRFDINGKQRFAQLGRRTNKQTSESEVRSQFRKVSHEVKTSGR